MMDRPNVSPADVERWRVARRRGTAESCPTGPPVDAAGEALGLLRAVVARAVTDFSATGDTIGAVPNDVEGTDVAAAAARALAALDAIDAALGRAGAPPAGPASAADMGASRWRSRS